MLLAEVGFKLALCQNWKVLDVLEELHTHKPICARTMALKCCDLHRLIMDEHIGTMHC